MKSAEPLIAVGLSYYNDCSSLERCLDSVVFNLPMRYTTVLAIDGKYKGYPDNQPLSTDGSHDLVRSYQDRYGSDKIQHFDYPNLHERYKRQQYVSIASGQTIPFLLILDSDEWLESKSPSNFLDELKGIDKAWHDRENFDKSNISGIDKVPRVSNVHMVRSIDLSDDGYIINTTQRPRLWYRPQDMHYTTKHYYWISKSVPAATEGDFKMLAQTAQGCKSWVVHDLQMWHSHNMRTQDRENKRVVYEREHLPRLER